MRPPPRTPGRTGRRSWHQPHVLNEKLPVLVEGLPVSIPQDSDRPDDLALLVGVEAPAFRWVNTEGVESVLQAGLFTVVERPEQLGVDFEEGQLHDAASCSSRRRLWR